MVIACKYDNQLQIACSDWLRILLALSSSCSCTSTDVEYDPLYSNDWQRLLKLSIYNGGFGMTVLLLNPEQLGHISSLALI